MKKIDNIELRTSSENPIVLDYDNLREAVLVLRATNHKIRQRIIELLHENEKMTVTKIYVALRIEQSVASQHLAILRNVGIVKTTREGKFIHYHLDNSRLDNLNGFINAIIE